MEVILVMAAVTVLLMVLAFLSLTQEDRELAREYVRNTNDAARVAEGAHP